LNEFYFLVAEKILENFFCFHVEIRFLKPQSPFKKGGEKKDSGQAGKTLLKIRVIRGS